MKIYHYANIDDWKRMRKKHELEGSQELLARRRLGRDHTEAWETAGVYGLFEPIPDSWKNNKEFNLTWDSLKHDIGGRLLLEIEVDPESDHDVFVIDRGHMEGFLYQNVENAVIPERYAHKKRAAAEKSYLESKISIKEFLERSEELNYSLPEVLITKNMPMERLKICSDQPFLDEILKESDCEYKRDFIQRIREIPELNVWYEKRTKEINNIGEVASSFKQSLK